MGSHQRYFSNQPSAAIRHVVFDPEGVLLDPTPGVRASLDATAREFGFDGHRRLPADWSPRCSLFSTLATLLDSEDCALIESAYAAYHRHFAELGRRRFVPQPCAAKLLQLMTAPSGCRWHYLSTLGRARSCQLLQEHGLGEAIGSVFSSDEMSCPGQRPQLLTALLGVIDANPASVMALADLPADLHAARSLGLQSVAVDYGRCPPDVLQRAPADHRADSIETLLSWLRPRIALRQLVVTTPAPPQRPRMSAAARLH